MTKENRYKSPLRYPGSKRKLVNYLEAILTHNKLSPKIIVEPFVGGGNVFLNFLPKDNVERIIIADKDELVYSFWKAVFFDTDFLINFISKARVNLRNFDRYKNIALNASEFGKRCLARACLFLNRTSFSGILTAYAGPIGGRKQESGYSLDCRFGRKNLINKIRKIASFRKKVTVLPYDWADTLRYSLRKFNQYGVENILFYFDPPFYKKADQLYRYYFEEKEHRKLRNRILRLRHPWILSYDRVKEIKDLYFGLKRIHLQMPYSINSPAKRIEKELIITSLKLPKLR